MKYTYIKIICLLVFPSLWISCEKKVNDWDIDPSHQRLFMPLKFEANQVGATSIDISYTQVISADKYVFEFSKDSLVFSEIVKTVEVFADTLTPFASSTSPARVEYHTLFEELDGNSRYSVRMKGVDSEKGLESDYVSLTFESQAEQLFSDWAIFTDRIAVQWIADDRVTNLMVYHAISGEIVQNIELSSAQKSAGSYEIKELEMGTDYRITLVNGELERGVLSLKTSGIQGGALIRVSPGQDLAALISTAIALGNTDVTLVFKGGQTYNLQTVSLPDGLTNVSFAGETEDEGVKPILNIKEVASGTLTLEQFLFEGVHLQGTDINTFLLNMASDGISIDTYAFMGCQITNFRSAIRLGNNAVHVGSILFDDCIIANMGGYGVVNTAGSTPLIDSITFRNSTLTELATQLMDVRNVVKQITIANCTFYNQNVAMTQLLRLDTKTLPQALVTDANIFAGTNSGGPINATSFDPTSTALQVSFAGSYRTSELTINKYEFTDISVFSGTASDLFVDAQNGDFHITPGANFGGRGSAGDPRWLR